MLKFVKKVSPRKRAEIEFLFEFYQEAIGFWVTLRKFHSYTKHLRATYKKQLNKYSKQYFALSKYIKPADLSTIADKLEA